VNRLSAERLRALRNDIPIEAVIRKLGLPAKEVEGYFRFLCPLCSEFHTATNPRTNLGRCFRCCENYNPIDLVMAVEKVSFLDAVSLLERMLKG
jgi:DNA primase